MRIWRMHGRVAERSQERGRQVITMLGTYLLYGGLLIMGVAFLADAAHAQAGNPQVVLQTSKGTITLELDPARAPITVENFLKYVDDGHFDGTVFHRVIPGFMIQAGGFTPDGKQKPTRPPIKNESGNGLSNAVSTIAMARTNDPNSATAQFFINVANNTQLDSYGGGYCVFGKVVEGLDVVDAITKVKLARNESGEMAKPTEPIIIQSAKRVDPK